MLMSYSLVERWVTIFILLFGMLEFPFVSLLRTLFNFSISRLVNDFNVVNDVEVLFNGGR